MSARSALIGYSGFVGGNLSAQHHFDANFNTSNIDEIEGQSFELLVSSATKAEMWLANADPDADWAGIKQLIDHLSRVKADQFVLISTVAVYPHPIAVDEDTAIDPKQATAYGRHRYQLEEFCRSHFTNCLVVRLPGLFGPGLKKNAVYDLIHNNNVDRIDSRGIYQFYNLEHIWSDIETALANKLPTLNLATPPVTIEEVAKYAFGRDFTQQTLPEDKLPKFDMYTRHARLFEGNGHYLATKQQVFADLSAFVEHEQRAL